MLERRPGRPLVVKELRDDQIQAKKMDQLRESLAPTVTMVRQLGVDREEAMRVLREMLVGEADTPTEKPEEETS